MASTYAWGDWEEKWPNGRFRCVFVESQPQPDGMICATGLYLAVDGDILYDIDKYQEVIRERAAVVADDNSKLLVKAEFAELLTLMPGFLQELTERLEELSPEQPQPKWPGRRYDIRTPHDDHRMSVR
jgi:hypothetical protein